MTSYVFCLQEYADDAVLKRIGLVCQILFTVEYGLKLATGAVVFICFVYGQLETDDVVFC